MIRRLAISLLSVSKIGDPAGPASPIDGDTMVVAGQTVRLHGIDAPELGQTFWWRGRLLDGGAMALAALGALTAGIVLRCEAVEQDRYGRLVAKCFSPRGVDVGRRLVASGWALAYRHYSTDYVDAEEAARKARRGLWQGRFMKPWAWRAMVARQAGAIPGQTPFGVVIGGRAGGDPARPA